MASAKLQSFRRDELIDATIAAIFAGGLQQITLNAIGKQAGLSPALVNHYFDGKAALLEATMQRLMREFGRAVSARLAARATPVERLYAIIDGCFSRRHFLPHSMVAWLSFWLEVRRDPRFERLQRILNRRFQSNVMFALRQLVPEPLAEDIAIGLTALVDGFWWAYAVDAKRIQPARARRICKEYLASRLPGTETAWPATNRPIRRAKRARRRS